MIETEGVGGVGPPIDDSPSLLAPGVAIVRSLRLRAPKPSGTGTVDHGAYAELL